jgi:hypothetical protein
MKKSRTLKIDDTFSVKVTVKETGDNYNQFATIFKGSSKAEMMFGTCFKNTDTNKKIKSWATERIFAPHNSHLHIN